MIFLYKIQILYHNLKSLSEYNNKKKTKINLNVQ